ncbi:MAG: exonuclease domain-containing protein [Bacillota bacterium]|nr:exonuclease domain-containing protein [Bacillota bacterium]
MELSERKMAVGLANEHLAAVLDTETTGLSNRDEVIELAIILFKFDAQSGRVIEILDQYTGLREPSCVINPFAQKVHGISMGSLKGKDFDYNRIKEIFMRAEFIVAHNAAFDRRMLGGLLPYTADQNWRCSCKDIKWKQKGFSSAKLGELLSAHGIECEHAHRALDDTESLLRLLGTRDGSEDRTYLYSLIRK